MKASKLDKPKISLTNQNSVRDTSNEEYSYNISNSFSANNDTEKFSKVVESKPCTEPPPGFKTSYNSDSDSTNVNPPPGFSLTPSFEPSIDLISPPILSYQSFESSIFIKPLDFDNRNTNLITEIRKVTEKNNFFTKFIEVSKKYRQSIISAEEYYNECIEMLGLNQFRTIFTELVVLLPDIVKQRELLLFYQRFLLNNNSESIKSNNDISMDIFDSCFICGQVFTKDESLNHHSNHNFEAEFPTLG